MAIDWKAASAERARQPYRVVKLVPLGGDVVAVSLCDTAGTLERCLVAAARFTRSDDREYDWTLPYRVAQQDDAMRALGIGDHGAKEFAGDAIPLNFVDRPPIRAIAPDSGHSPTPSPRFQG